ncbi:hypothetical protein AXK57_11070 [Tsukamurella pulmonis]|uniref:Secretory lipase n=2 Tax=Tsukamurella pulmonis TaxID=47312 RepID=A0A1H1EXA4_9ACTN|nr:lipase family protein [Tsukamurella pulmonis]KXO91772.1 hypothetical protein AXK56_01200 [Tsukamurella pulmonis]KXP09426.1 hypothetical protein AXK57_11070 [Tsukamurella pulmonis]SDQ93164.1 Secretory lipase [Tsukamurella pulmonis]SUP20392.1 Secretory lipase [Tsukamurella pulmonis]
MRRPLLAVLAATALLAPASPATATPAPAPALGTVVGQGPLALPDGVRDTTATRIQYVSRTPSGAPITVTAGVYVPRGPEPAGGRPLVAMGHGTSGVNRQCAPTTVPDQFGNAPYLADLLRRGFAVVLTDYQGLGGEGVHPYLDSTSHGLDMLGSVRAARTLPVRFTPQTVLYGNSQGGRATEAAAELAPTRTPELRFAGNAMVSPALRIDYLPAVDAGRLSPTQYAIAPMLVRGAQAVDPSIRTEAVLRGPILAQRDALLSCTARMPATVNLSSVVPDDVRPEPGVRARFAAFFDRNQLPRTPNRGIPALVVYGRSDDLVDPAWTLRASADLCRAGVPLELAPRAGGHTSTADMGTVGRWIEDRFAGRPARSTCSG